MEPVRLGGLPVMHRSWADCVVGTVVILEFDEFQMESDYDYVKGGVAVMQIKNLCSPQHS